MHQLRYPRFRNWQPYATASRPTGSREPTTVHRRRRPGAFRGGGTCWFWVGRRRGTARLRGRGLGDPFGGAVFAFAGGPAALGQWVVAGAGKREVVDVGRVALCVGGDVVDFGVVAGHVASGSCTATVLGTKVTVVRPTEIAWSAGGFARTAVAFISEGSRSAGRDRSRLPQSARVPC